MNPVNDNVFNKKRGIVLIIPYAAFEEDVENIINKVLGSNVESFKKLMDALIFNGIVSINVFIFNIGNCDTKINAINDDLIGKVTMGIYENFDKAFKDFNTIASITVKYVASLNKLKQVILRNQSLVSSRRKAPKVDFRCEHINEEIEKLIRTKMSDIAYGMITTKNIFANNDKSVLNEDIQERCFYDVLYETMIDSKNTFILKL